MANRSTARHRAACRPSTPLTAVSQKLSESDSRRKALAVAGSGLAIGAIAASPLPAVVPAQAATNPTLAHSSVNAAVTAPTADFGVAVTSVQTVQSPAEATQIQGTTRTETLAGSSAPSTALTAVAQRYVGTPYVYGASGPTAFDCSGFVSYVYAQFGKHVPHQSGAIAASGSSVPLSQAQPGDIVWHPGHVGIYLGNGKVIHANHPGGSVVVSNMSGMGFTKAVRF